MLLKKTIITLFILSCLMFSLLEAEEVELSAEDKEYIEWSKNIWESLEPQTGEIKLSGTVATLNVPQDFYFLNAKDANTVLVDVWGNPPSQSTLGMLFPAGSTPFDGGSWAVTVEYEEDGYVSDEDADDIDYQELLDEMKSDVEMANKERISLGYESVSLVGWAAPPFYDKKEHKLHWAKEIKFGDAEENTLNYNIRVLGRKGVLVLNFIASMDQKHLIDTKIDTVLALADFDPGAKYGDFNPDLDEVAAYGLGALVAGKVIAKTGFLAMGLIFLKKFGIIILLAVGALFKKIFSKKAD